MKTAAVRWASVIFGVGAIPIVSAGCDNRHLLGGFDGGGADSTQPQPMDASVTPIDGGGSPDGPGNLQDAAVFAQSWTGYLENYMFRSGSDAVRISFTPDATGQVSGVVRLGNGTPPPPPTDPNVGYPADLVSGGFEVAFGAREYLAEGFAYSMRTATVVGPRLRFMIDNSELWREWCALQMPAGTSGTCLPNEGAMTSGDGQTCGIFDPAANRYVPVDCGKLALCGFSGTCMCDASGCAVRTGENLTVFDVTFDDVRASGSTTGRLGNHNVHFTKDP
jgi:hypothetical protein